MEHSNKKTVIRKTLTSIGLIFLVICLLIVLVFPKIISRDIEQHLNQNALHTATIVKSALESSVSSKQTIERLIDDKLYIASIEIARKLGDKNIEEITQEELKSISNELGLYDISLLIRKNNDIVIAKSSNPDEAGLSTKDWGYWYTGFDQLMSGKEVTVGKGYYRNHFWSGPISKSEVEDKYFKFAYYYDGTAEYMINPFVQDEYIYGMLENSGPQSLINRINKNKDLEEIAVINVNALTEARGREIIEPEEDLPVLYGENTFHLKKDLEYYQKALKSDKAASLDFDQDGVKHRKFYIPISNDRVMVVVADLSKQEALLNRLMVLFISSFVIAFIVIYIVLQLVTRKYLKPLSTINKHINRIASGDLTNKIKIFKENEWAEISLHLNKMTDDISLLISETKKKIDSVTIVSSLLNNTVQSYFKTMDEISSSMTHESRELFYEIDLRVSDIQNNYVNLLKGMENKEEFNKDELISFSNFIIESSREISALNGLLKSHVRQITEMSLSSYDAIDQLNNMISQLDNVSKELKNQIKIFKISEK